jgi:hypothetical protein
MFARGPRSLTSRYNPRMSDAPDNLHTWLESVFALRDETLYRQFFNPAGPQGDVLYPLSDENFRTLGTTNPDPRFLSHGVFEFAPTEDRPHWLYASAGMSNPWGQSPPEPNTPLDPDAYSGLGYELTLHTRDRQRWPIQLLHWIMTVQLLVATGQMQGELLQPYDRIPLGGSIGKKDGTITHLLVLTPDDFRGDTMPDSVTYPARFPLPSGNVDLLVLLGISAREADFVRTQGVEALLNLLAHHNFLPFTDPNRLSAV